ncbi:hypothetical protein MVEN_02244600 [Mycena venus]|uniref:Uncharacterized protein n=1 Tax=Mycena venus TaxID=2733690 RepID=A0A8H7CGD2_9AGAR|nr:hypothetical protein MVEN_02244600 [Mycena venus]
MSPPWWANEPVTRGTYSLVSSCIFTLGLCVWTAIHLNIPEQAPGARQFLRKLTWLAMGLLAPEVVTFVAWNQHATAGRLVRALRTTDRRMDSIWRKFLRRITRSKSKYETVAGVELHEAGVPPTHLGEDWTLIHGFYAVMGGYVIDFSNAGDPFLPNGFQRLTLTPDGIQFLLQHAPEVIPHVSEEDINDKSKADGLAKLLVAFQAAWFCLQCIARGAQHLPISLLEITTGGHALYTLFTYLLWAQKPLNITVPTLIPATDDAKLRRLCAYMFMCSRISGEAAAKVHGDRSMANGEEFKWISSITESRDDVQGPNLTGGDTSIASLPPSSFNLRRGAFLPGTGFHFEMKAVYDRPGKLSRGGITGRSELRLAHRDVLRWRLAWEALVADNTLQPTNCQYFVSRASNVPAFDSWEHATSRMILAFTAAEVVYAIIHAMGWNAEFASANLRVAWRMASCIIGGGGIFPRSIIRLGRWRNDIPPRDLLRGGSHRDTRVWDPNVPVD